MVSAPRRWQHAAVLASAVLATVASIDGHACIRQSANSRVRVSFLADSDLAAVVKWAMEQTCTDFSVDRSLSSRRVSQGVIMTVLGRDVETVLEVLLHTMNLRLSGKSGGKRTIVAMGPETDSSKTIREREDAGLERSRILDNIGAEITKTDDSHYVISRKGMDAVMGNLKEIGHSVRLVPAIEDGKPVGFRLSSMRTGSILMRVGFQNGDVVQAVNDLDLTTPDKALEAYAKLKTASVLRFSVIRNEKPVLVETAIH